MKCLWSTTNLGGLTMTNWHLSILLSVSQVCWGTQSIAIVLICNVIILNRMQKYKIHFSNFQTTFCVLREVGLDFFCLIYNKLKMITNSIIIVVSIILFVLDWCVYLYSYYWAKIHGHKSWLFALQEKLHMWVCCSWCSDFHLYIRKAS